MAYNKVYPTVNAEVLEYTKNQEDRIASGFGDIADYVVEYVNSDNGGYVKKESGTLIQWGTYTGNTSTSGYVNIQPHIPFKSNTKKYVYSNPRGYGNRLNSIVSYMADAQTLLLESYVTQGGVALNNQSVSFDWLAIGFWK